MKLSRNFNQRKALIRTQLNSFVNLGRITTSEARAKMIKPLIDRLITKAKVGSLHARRQLAGELANVSSANRLVDIIAPLFVDQKSGFATSAKVKIRRGDATTMVMLKLTADLPQPAKTTPAPEVTRTRGSSGASSKKSPPTPEAARKGFAPTSTPEAARKGFAPTSTPEAARRDSSGVSSKNKTKK